MAGTDGGLTCCTRKSSRMAAVWIVAAASCHYFGYEFVRAASTTQFTEHFGSKMLPVGISMVPVLAVGLLTLYRYLLIQHGPYTTLVCSTLLCATGLCIGVVGATSGVFWVEQGSVWFIFVFREAYISWLQSQYWSRLTSCLPQKDAKTVFGPILGIASVFATLGGLSVAPVVRNFGDFAGVALCSGCLLLSLFFVRFSFEAGDQQHRLHGHGHGHGHGHKRASDESADSPDPINSPRRVPVTRTARERALSGASGHGLSDKALDAIDEAAAGESEPLVRAGSPMLRHPPPVTKSAAARCWSAVRSCEHGDAFGLSSLKASPILPWLFVSTMSMQVLATCITLCFQNFLVVAYAGDAAERSAFTGTFYALAKAVSAALQFLGVPLLFRQVPLSTILALMPTVVLLGVATLAYAPSLVTASGLLLVFKITEYSMFSAAREMLYMPLSFEARYMAKEVVDVFGYRLGKGGTALCVAFVLPLATPTPFAFTVMAVLAAGGWCWSVFRLRQAVVDDRLGNAAASKLAGVGTAV